MKLKSEMRMKLTKYKYEVYLIDNTENERHLHLKDIDKLDRYWPSCRSKVKREVYRVTQKVMQSDKGNNVGNSNFCYFYSY